MDDSDYVQRLVSISNKRTKRYLQVVNPYRINLRRWIRGSCLEIGCGIGRNLTYLSNPNNVGVDTNNSAISHCRSIGHTVYTNTEFAGSTNFSSEFDNVLYSHVLEHMNSDQAVDLICKYKRNLKQSGRVVIICPQQRGFNSDPTHVEYFNFEKLEAIVLRCNLVVEKSYSHPLPRIFSRLFIYNEFVVIARQK